MRSLPMRSLLVCTSLALAMGCGDNITEPVPTLTRLNQITPPVSFATTTTEDGLTISTDKDDYAPGDTVHLTGAGWAGNDVLDIRLDDEPATHDPHTWTITVGEDGTFHDSTYVVDVGDLEVRFTLTATSRATGQSLVVTFRDGNIRILARPAGTTFTLSSQRYSSDNCAVGTEQGGAGSDQVTSTSPVVFGRNDNQSVKVTVPATAANGAAFVTWENDGNVTVVSGSLTSSTLCLRGFGGEGSRSIFAKYAAVATNSAPVLTPIGNKVVDEQTLLTFTAQATDAQSPPQVLSFSLENGAAGLVPPGAVIISTSGVFSWTPTEAQGPASYTLDVCVADNGSPSLKTCETIVITVNEVNRAPILAEIEAQTVDELTSLSFTASATDEDVPANTLTFALAAGTNPVPTGASIDPSSGVFSWTPTEAQGPGVYTFKVVVSDNGSPALSDEQEVTVTVNEVNQAPVLGSIGNKTVNEGLLLTFTATATDDDLPPNTLRFGLTGTVPAGASIDAVTGVFTWTPTDDDPTATLFDDYLFTVVVTDNGLPALSDNEQITVTVHNVAPTITSWVSAGSTTTGGIWGPTNGGSTSEATPLPGSVIIGTALNIQVSFTDPGSRDTHTAEFDCGSGIYSAAVSATSPFGYSCPFNSIGQYTIRVKITDDDGGYDEESHTITVKYNFIGFFAPVDRPTTYNVSKAGQAIPLKWRLTDASGLGITDLTGVVVQAVGIDCSLGTTQDQLEEYATGATGLQNHGNGYYQFNWKTPTEYAGSCKSIVLVFGSGGLGYTEGPHAYFSFKK
jgi:hypothetical protein